MAYYMTSTAIKKGSNNVVCFLMGQPWPLLLFNFGLFQTNIITIFTKNMCENCPSSIWCWDLNPQPSEHESPPITIRPGLPPNVVYLFGHQFDFVYHLQLFLLTRLSYQRVKIADIILYCPVQETSSTAVYRTFLSNT